MRTDARHKVSSPDEHVGYWLRFISNHSSRAFAYKLRGLGVSVAEWMVLRTMYGSAISSPSALAATLGLTRGAVSKLIDRLVSKNWITRTASTDDRRSQTISMTAAGKKLVPRMTRLAEQNEAEFFFAINGKERARLLGQMRDIAKRHGLKQLPID